LSMQDPVADMLTRIRNGQMAKHTEIKVGASKLKLAIAKVLKSEGYISDFKTYEQRDGIESIDIQLKYYEGRPVIDRIRRVSRPGLRIYKSCEELTLPHGFGILVMSTSKGVISHIEAKKLGIGGELLCEVA
jgi:small subunit ribosomal protein S8